MGQIARAPTSILSGSIASTNHEIGNEMSAPADVKSCEAVVANNLVNGFGGIGDNGPD